MPVCTSYNVRVYLLIIIVLLRCVVIIYNVATCVLTVNNFSN